MSALVRVPAQWPGKEILLLHLILPSSVPMMVYVAALRCSCIYRGTLVRRRSLYISPRFRICSGASGVGTAAATVAVGVVRHVVACSVTTWILQTLDELLIISPCSALSISYTLYRMLHFE
jgi:hypothetical protein